MDSKQGKAESASDVLNASEAAVFLRVHVETLRRFARRGDIPSFKVGKDWRFRREDLRRWIESQHQFRRPEASGNVRSGLEEPPDAVAHLPPPLPLPLDSVRDAESSPSGVEVGRDRSVLIVDDDRRVCQAMCRMVESFGFRARFATSGSLGLAQIESDVPDLILLDLLMPEMNGPQFLEQLRRRQPDLPVVIVTGYPDGKLMKAAAQFAPVMLLAKPVESALLERTIRTVIGEDVSIRAEG